MSRVSSLAHSTNPIKFSNTTFIYSVKLHLFNYMYINIQCPHLCGH